MTRHWHFFGITPLLALFVSSWCLTGVLAQEAPAKCGNFEVTTAKGLLCLEVGATFNDGKGLPDMVVMPGGTLAIGKYETSLSQFEVFAAETKLQAADDCISPFGDWDKSYKNPGFEQKPSSPVVCINWDEALSFTNWLSRKTGHAYRLPTVTELQAAAMGDKALASILTSKSKELCKHANLLDLSFSRKFVAKDRLDCRDKYVFTAPAGRKLPNAFGLYDVVGNADEMVDTCSGASSLTCAERAIIGGSWLTREDEIGQRRYMTAWRSNSIGFRVVRELKP